MRPVPPPSATLLARLDPLAPVRTRRPRRTFVLIASLSVLHGALVTPALFGCPGAAMLGMLLTMGPLVGTLAGTLRVVVAIVDVAVGRTGIALPLRTLGRLGITEANAFRPIG